MHKIAALRCGDLVQGVRRPKPSVQANCRAIPQTSLQRWVPLRIDRQVGAEMATIKPPIAAEFIQNSTAARQKLNALSAAGRLGTTRHYSAVRLERSAL